MFCAFPSGVRMLFVRKEKPDRTLQGTTDRENDKQFIKFSPYSKQCNFVNSTNDFADVRRLVSKILLVLLHVNLYCVGYYIFIKLLNVNASVQ